MPLPPTASATVTLLLSLWLALASAPALAQGEDEERTYQGRRYACTGIGLPSREDPRWRAYPLKLMFATARGEYIADVEVTITDGAGAVVLQAPCEAPWVLVDLEPGRYRVAATAEGAHRQSATVSVAAGKQTAVTFRFPGIE